MSKLAKSERQSYVQGHMHKVSVHSETYEVNGLPETVVAISAGTLANIHGDVPSTRGGVDDMGNPVTRWESWQQAVVVITENIDDGTYAFEIANINHGRTLFRGKTFEAVR
jgi:hypothetical protein